MHGGGFLLPALVYLAAALVMVPLFKRIGLGTVLGYLVAGVAIGPWGLGLVTDFERVTQVSELGVVMLPVVVASAAELLPVRDVDVGRTVKAVLRNDDPQADLSPGSGRRKQRLILVELDGQVRVFSRRGQARGLQEAIFKG